MPEETILAVGAHPDDIEFGCGALLLKEIDRGNLVFMLVLTKGEAGSNGTPEERLRESQKAARLMGAELEFIDLGGDAHLECKPANAIAIATHIRQQKPSIVLAPLDHKNQHPDHWKAGRLTSEAARLARYGGLAELREWPVHRIGHLYYYAITGLGSQPGENMAASLVVDISEEHERWNELMKCHQSQLKTLDYLELQNTRARLLGIEIGTEYAMRLFTEDPVRVAALSELSLSARIF